MESELKDHILLGSDSSILNILVDMANARLKTGLPYRSGGLFDQPYFMVAYVEPWVEEAYAEIGKIQGLGAEGESDTYQGIVAALNAQLVMGARR
jgi:hypothetical protein